MGRSRHGRSGNESVVGRLSARERWEQLVDATNYGHLQRLGVLMNILSPGKQYWSVVEWRCKLKAVRGPAASRFDYDAWDSWLRAQAEVERQRQERLAAEREEQALVDAVRLGRLAELTAKVTAKRKRVWDIEHRYAGKAEILNTLKRELARWELIKDVPLCLAEIGWCWESGKLWKYDGASPPHPTPPRPVPPHPHPLPIPTPSHIPSHIPVGFIYGGTLSELSVLWEQVPVLAPLEQQPDARGNIKLRNNSRLVRKLRHAKHCLLEALLFATEERVRAAHRPAHPPARPPARPPAC